MDFSTHKLLYHPQRLASILQGEDFWPVQIELSPTMACNQQCVWCIDLEWRRSFAGALEMVAVESMLRTCYAHGTRGLSLEGGGEPTTSPFFRPLVELGSDIGYDLGLITNGVLLDRYADLVSRFTWLRVSLDAYDPAYYHRMHGSPHFDRVWHNLGLAAEARGQARLGVSFLVTPEQGERDGLRMTCTRAKALGLQYVQFKRVAGHADLWQEAWLDAADFADLVGDGFQVFVQPAENHERGNGGLPCRAHAFSVQVGPAGDVFVCCRLRQAPLWRGWIGNIYHQDFADIWNGPVRQVLRAELLDGRYTSAHCPECRFVPVNALLDQLITGDAARSFI